MDVDSEEKLVFDAEWYQADAAVTREFVLNFFTKDNSIELIDVKAKKFFLRRTPVDTVCGRDLFPGSRVHIFGRKIHITNYGNPETKELLIDKSQKAFFLVPGQQKNKLDKILTKICKYNLKLDNILLRQITSDDLIQLNLMEDERIATIKYNIQNEPSIIFELSGRSVDQKIQEIQEEFPGVFGCGSENIIEHFFKSTIETITLPSDDAKQRDSVLCLIKPHILHSNATGDVLGHIYRQGFTVANIKLCHLDRSQSDEFLQVYEGVVPEFIQMSLHLTSGPFIALELTYSGGDGDGDKEDIHTKFRNLCGPFEWELAKKLRPHTLRAEFGVDNVCNAVHCTDLKEDVKRELDFFFG